MLHADNISAAAANDFANLAQLSRTVIQYDHKVGLATGSDLAAGDNARKDIYIDIATGNEANSFLAFDGQLIENGCGHRSCTGALSQRLANCFNRAMKRHFDVLDRGVKDHQFSLVLSKMNTIKIFV